MSREQRYRTHLTNSTLRTSAGNSLPLRIPLALGVLSVYFLAVDTLDAAQSEPQPHSQGQANTKEQASKTVAKGPIQQEKNRSKNQQSTNAKTKSRSQSGKLKSGSPKKQSLPKQKKCVIGATAILLEKQSELLFKARVDSGAKSCSLHIEKMEIENEVENMRDNIGKVVRFLVKNGDNKTHWLSSKITGYVIIKTSDNRERRYKVPLTFRWKHMEKEVLVTLNNRQHMEYPLLLGRNFLRGDFLIDVELDSKD